MADAEDVALLLEYREACAGHDRLKAAVLQWMADEGAALRLRTNSEAPMWSEYSAAADRMRDLGDRLGRPDAAEKAASEATG